MDVTRVDSPEDLRALAPDEVVEYCGALRQFLIDSVTKTGGHLGSNLGVVELTVALHRVLDLAHDRLVLDTSHQVYPHKAITGRRDRFPTLRMTDGLSGFMHRGESPYDTFTSGHAGTAVSACGSNLSYNWGDNGEEAGFTSFSVGGVTLTQTSTSGEAPGDGGDGVPSFVTRTTQTGNQFGFYTMRMDTNASETSAENATFQFSEPATWLTFQLLDVDWTNNAWEDYIRVDGFDADGNLVPKQMVLANAQLSFAGDWVEADAAAAANTTIGNVTVAFARPVRSLRVEYAQGDEPAAPNFQFIGISDFQFCAFDYGDAPDGE